MATVLVRRGALAVALGCSVVLLFAYHAQRTEWTALGGRRGNRLLVYPDPSAWNLWASVCGVFALVALLAGLWAGRRAFVAALVAAGVFAFAAITTVGYWAGLSADAVPPGRAALGPEWTFRPAGGLVVYAVAALLGVASSVVVSAAWRRTAPGEPTDEATWSLGDGSAEAWFVRMGLPERAGHPPASYDTRRAAALPGWAAGTDGAALGLAIACAIPLLFALVAPPEFARTTWMYGSANRMTRLTDSPAGYVGVLSLCGLVALVCLGLAAASGRLRVAAATGATAAFAAAVWVAVTYALHVWRGVMGVEGHVEANSRWPNEIIDAPELLPIFVLFAVAGACGALAFAASGWTRQVVANNPAARRSAGDGTSRAMLDQVG